MTTQRYSGSEGYSDAVDGLDSFGRLVSELITALLHEAKISFLTVTHRVKKSDSAAKKMEKDPVRYTTFESIHDLLGVRVITYFSDDVDKVGEIIEREFSVDRQNSVDKRRLLDDREFGYLSLHYVLSLDEKRSSLPEYRKYAGRLFELQIRSTLQHAWAEIEHDLGYKYARSLPTEVRRHFARVASLLESADGDFVRLRDAISSSERQAATEVREHPESPLTPLNALAFVKNDPVGLEFDTYLRDYMGAKFVEGGTLYVSEEAIGVLNDCGISTIQQLESLYRNKAEELRQFAHLWMGSDERGSISREIERGISVYYVELYSLAKLGESKRKALVDKYGRGFNTWMYEEKFKSASSELAKSKQDES